MKFTPRSLKIQKQLLSEGYIKSEIPEGTVYKKSDEISRYRFPCDDIMASDILSTEPGVDHDHAIGLSDGWIVDSMWPCEDYHIYKIMPKGTIQKSITIMGNEPNLRPGHYCRDNRWDWCLKASDTPIVESPRIKKLQLAASKIKHSKSKLWRKKII